MQWTTLFAGRTAEMKRTAVRELLKLTAQPGMISFAGGLPAPDLFPISEVKSACDEVLSSRGRSALQYGETEGVGELRDWIAEQFSKPGFSLSRRHVLITSGGQQALDLLGRVLLDPGDAVAVENPTYLALLSAWRPTGARFIPVQSDHDGMIVEGLKSSRANPPKVIYLVPNFQNPQGTTLSLARRRQLIDYACEQGVAIVEDNPYGALRYSGEPLEHLLHVDAATGVMSSGGRDTHVIHVGTFSKVFAPGLRLGWVIAPESVIDKLVQAKQSADLHTSTLAQYVTLHLVKGGLLERQVTRLCDAYRERRDAMLSALETHFPHQVTWTRPDGGMFLMVRLPSGLNAREVLERAIAAHVAFVPGEEFHLNGAGRNTMRLNFSNPSPAQIEEGVKRLGEVIADSPPKKLLPVWTED